MSDDRKDLPNYNSPAFLMKVAEALQTYLGYRGDKLDRGLTVRDLYEAGLVSLSNTYRRSGSGPPVIGPGPAVNPVYEVDLTPPPTPTGFIVSAAISNVFIGHDAPLYTQGHGHAKTLVYGATRASGAPAPTFGNAVKITEFSGTVFAYPTNPATTWHLWIKWVTIDGVESASPAGGTNGLAVTTGQDVSLLLTALTGQITASQLYTDLGSRINLIDAPDTGLVTKIATIQATVGGNTAALQSETTARVTADGTLFAQYTVKIDNAGLISGFGLASTAGNAAPTSGFGVRANAFYVAAPAVASATAPTLNLYDGYVWLDTSVTPNVTRYRSGSSWVLNSPVFPFVVQTTPTTINGVAVPVGVYMTDAFIQNGTITNVKIGNAAIDDAKVANLSASKIIAGSIAVGQYIQSTSYVSGSAGWRINGNGTAEFSEAIVRGTVYAAAGLIGGITIASNAVRAGQTSFNSGTGFHLGSNGTFSVGNSAGNRLTWDGTNLNVVSPGLTLVNGAATFSGALAAASGTFSGALNAATGSFSGSLSAATGTFAGLLTAAAINAVDSINIAGNAVTVPVGARTYGLYYFGPGDGSYRETTVMTTTLSGTQGQPVWIHVNCGAFSSDDQALVAPAVIRLVVDNTAVLQNDAATPNRLNSGYYMASSPAYSFTIAVVVGGSGSSVAGSAPGVYPNAALFAIAAKR